MGLHRQRDDGRAIDALGAATDEAIGGDRLLDMIGDAVDGTVIQCGEHANEPERAAAIGVVGARMGMRVATSGGPALFFILRMKILRMKRTTGMVVHVRRSVTVHMHVRRPVTVHMHVRRALGLQGSDLAGDFIEAIGRDGVRDQRQRHRRHDHAGKVEQRRNGRGTPSVPAGENPKHRLPHSMGRVRSTIVPIRMRFGKNDGRFQGERSDLSPAIPSQSGKFTRGPLSGIRVGIGVQNATDCDPYGRS